MRIKFSVVIPLFNKENSILHTVNSVLNQTYGDFELIIVNDGSTDSSIKVLESIQDERIRIINKENGGVSSARNVGIKEAKNDWISFIDGDDLWLPGFLEMVLKMINKYSKASVIAIGWKYDTDKKQDKYNTEGYINNYFKLSLKYSGILCSSAVTIKKECFNIIGCFCEDLNRGEDLEMWIRLARRFRIAYTPSVYAVYQLETENRACKTRYPLQKSIVSKINFKNKNNYERKYLQKLIKNKIKNAILSKDLNTAFTLIKKYNFKIFL